MHGADQIEGALARLDPAHREHEGAVLRGPGAVRNSGGEPGGVHPVRDHGGRPPPALEELRSNGRGNADMGARLDDGPLVAGRQLGCGEVVQVVHRADLARHRVGTDAVLGVHHVVRTLESFAQRRN